MQASTPHVCAVLTLWLYRYPEASSESYVFPRHKVGLGGDKREPWLWDVKHDVPIGEWKKTWDRTRRLAGVKYRWHDLRHTFITRLAESPTVIEETIRALAGHVSRRMLERYSHIRVAAKQAAIATLEQTAVVQTNRKENQADSPQNPPQGEASGLLN